MSCSKLTAREVEYLTRILRILPDAEPRAYKSCVSTLLSSSSAPSALKRPCRLTVLINRSQHPDRLPLCALHRRLNPSIIYSLYNRLAREVGRNLNSLVRNAQLLNAEQGRLVERLRKLHALWFAPRDYAKMFLAPPPVEAKCRFQHNGCEACILARIGGDREVLLDLRTVLLSRTRTTRSSWYRDQPTLLVFVDAWLKGLAIGHEDNVQRKSWTVVQALKAVRKTIWKERTRCSERDSERASEELGLRLDGKSQYRRAVEVREVLDLDSRAARAALSDLGCEALEWDTENDIINYYAAAASTLHLSSPSTTYRTTAAEAGGSETSGTAWLASAALNRSAEEWAQSYQDLLATSAWDPDLGSEEDRLHGGGA